MSQSFVDPDIATISKRLMDTVENLFASHLFSGARAAGYSRDDSVECVRELVPVMMTLVQGFNFQSKIDPAADTQILLDRVAAVLPDSYSTIEQLKT